VETLISARKPRIDKKLMSDHVDVREPDREIELVDVPEPVDGNRYWQRTCGEHVLRSRSDNRGRRAHHTSGEHDRIDALAERALDHASIGLVNGSVRVDPNFGINEVFSQLVRNRANDVDDVALREPVEIAPELRHQVRVTDEDARATLARAR